MEEKKNNKGLIWLIIILIVLVLGLIGFVVYDKLLKIDKTIPNYDKNSTTITTTMTTSLKIEEEFAIELKDLNFPTKNDTSVIIYGDIEEYLNDEDKQKIQDLVYNYQNISLNKENIVFKFSCSEFNMDEQFCYEETININNNFNITFSLDRGSGEQSFFLITNKYIIVQKSNSAIMDGNIEIYDYDGNLLKTIENTTNYLVVHGEHCEYLYGGDISYNMRLVNNKLHYIDSSATYKTLDLDNFEENVVSLINASTSQQC